MRSFIALTLLLFFSAQSLALAAPSGCGGEMGSHQDHQSHHDIPVEGTVHAGMGHADMDHASMPCCDGTAAPAAEFAEVSVEAPVQMDGLCQLGCAAAAASVSAQVAPAPGFLVLSGLFPEHDSTSIAPPRNEPDNLLRPPIHA
ncbi:hypothetical protein [Biformimicrobium ophioploci]|uniref:Uncharacterized protein n=1 Tax=Biformimicrobium ophioploci TaxID=3036711 RepID=A0ABQ6LVF8_9GAMM|nr:hypothetical protein [Microbulbifer sp. NKW57]GMG86079.1 hypothetical protein MNKW57_04000 [Microbulbifer sp. NKW57]